MPFSLIKRLDVVGKQSVGADDNLRFRSARIGVPGFIELMSPAGIIYFWTELGSEAFDLFKPIVN